MWRFTSPRRYKVTCPTPCKNCGNTSWFGDERNSSRSSWMIGRLSHTRNERKVPELILVLGSQPAGDRSHKPGGRLPLHPARPAVTSPAAKHHRSLASTKLYCLVTEARACKQLALGWTRKRDGRDSNPRPVYRKFCLSDHSATEPYRG